jgi:hypothetical protein
MLIVEAMETTDGATALENIAQTIMLSGADAVETTCARVVTPRKDDTVETVIESVKHGMVITAWDDIVVMVSNDMVVMESGTVDRGGAEKVGAKTEVVDGSVATIVVGLRWTTTE